MSTQLVIKKNILLHCWVLWRARERTSASEVIFSKGMRPRLAHILSFPLENPATMTTKGARWALRGKTSKENSWMCTVSSCASLPSRSWSKWGSAGGNKSQGHIWRYRGAFYQHLAKSSPLLQTPPLPGEHSGSVWAGGRQVTAHPIKYWVFQGQALIL